MMSETSVSSAREVLGMYLQQIIETQKIQKTTLEEKSGLTWFEIQQILQGESYEMDHFLKLVHGLDLYVFFSPKNGTNVDFDFMLDSAAESDPNL